jgi:5-methylcytosine-specific restriction endonuclease McrA
VKRPWMPFYIADYLVETTRLNALESGAYLLLMMEYWQSERLPEDDRKLAQIAKLSLRKWRQIKPAMSDLFQVPGWRHHRLDALRAKVDASYNRRLAYLRSLDARRPDPLEWSVIRDRIFKRDDFTCTYCFKRGGDLECDHIIPVARGGGNEDDNLTTACKPCNQSKGALLLSEWRQ